MNVEILTRLNPPTVSPDRIPGGEITIDSAAVAYALSGLNRSQTALAMFAYQGEAAEFGIAWTGLQDKARQSRHYKAEKHADRVSDLCHLAIREFTTQKHCKLCEGTGVIAKQNYKACNRCDGVGSLPYSDRRRAMEINKCHTSWYIYRDLYGYLHEVLQSWDDVIKRTVTRKLR